MKYECININRTNLTDVFFYSIDTLFQLIYYSYLRKLKLTMYIKFYNVWYIYFETGMYVNKFEQMTSYSKRITLVT